jgi:serine/threonine protein kinase
LLGERLGIYRIIREIGRGGMGSVYLASRDDAEFQKEVALKIVKRGMDTAEVLQRFRYERQILAN